MRMESTGRQQGVREFVSFEEALELILDAAVPVGTVEKRWDEALGDVLAEEITAGEPLPPFDQSAVDGYAVRAEETNGATPQRFVSLRVIDEVAAGAVSRQTLAPGTVIRIMTGAAVPSGADAVVPVEQTAEEGPSMVNVLAPVQPGDFLRRAGEDLQPGTRVFQSGTRLSPARIGLLALLGRTTVKLYRKPSVAILATGNELTEVGATPAIGKIRNANSSMLGAMARELGCRLRDLGVARDDVASISAKLRRGLGADVVITSGGVSVGRHDHVIEAMQSCGVELLFRKVKIKPGMPLVVGRCRRTLFFGLPGNPVSALVTFLQFVRPALLKMMGAEDDFDRTVVPAVLEHEIVKADRKRHFHRAIVERRNGGYTVRSSGGQGSHMMASLARANGLIPIPEDSSGFAAGQRVQVELL
jgi:molybdopterin molybdotransferase